MNYRVTVLAGASRGVGQRGYVVISSPEWVSVVLQQHSSSCGCLSPTAGGGPEPAVPHPLQCEKYKKYGTDDGPMHVMVQQQRLFGVRFTKASGEVCATRRLLRQCG